MITVVETLVIVAILALTARRCAYLLAALRPPRPLPPATDLPSVTVLVPARNESPVAGRVLDALARLEYPADRLSFVLVADGCTDNTPALFHAWAASRSDTQVVVQPTALGKAAALNAGLLVASGHRRGGRCRLAAAPRLRARARAPLRRRRGRRRCGVFGSGQPR
ncbi:MAG: glycosyltransferase [Gemmatimonadetes bacterium]|nr:glycosyltransferase [Gemmatimonadota bacterium]